MDCFIIHQESVVFDEIMYQVGDLHVINMLDLHNICVYKIHISNYTHIYLVRKNLVKFMLGFFWGECVEQF